MCHKVTKDQTGSTSSTELRPTQEETHVWVTFVYFSQNVKKC